MKLMVGGCRRGRVTAVRWFALVMMAASLPEPACARDRFAFDIRGGPLSDAIVALGVQGGINIGLSDAGAQRVPVPAIKGRLTVEEALRRLLDGTGLRAVPIDGRTYIIAAARAKPVKRAPVPPVIETSTAADIVVTASKRDTRLRDFPGSIAMLDATREGLNSSARNGTQSIVNSLPVLTSTHLGPGRNKLIIRGIADSSFSGPTQAIVGQYLGEIRLNYNAPDPDLNLYDMANVEVLEGPQGTLYGAGSLGGIVRLVPNPVDLLDASASVAAGLVMVDRGGPSSDMAGMINLPVIGGTIAVRGVAYRTIDGGYIKDARRGVDHINRSKTQGGRLSLRIDPGDDWTVVVGGTMQDINNADGQYAERGLPRYTRRSAIAQPFDNDYRLGELLITKKWSNMTLVSATGVVQHDIGQQFDATPPRQAAPQVFHQKGHITLFSNENRLSRQRADGSGWLIGTSFISNSERLTRDLGPLSAPQRIAGVRNAVSQGALYGELSFTLGPQLIVTGGARVAYSRLIGELIDSSVETSEPSRSEVEVLPSLAFSWRPMRGLTTYLRYQEGFRPGGLSVSAGPIGVVSQRFQGDSISTFEGGARFHDPQHDRFAASISLSYAHWEHIQADLVDGGGLPITANIGDGRILGLEFNASWAIVSGVRIEGGLFLNDSELVRPDPGFEDALHGELPNVGRLGARAALAFERPLSERWSLSARGSVRYFGHSTLGVGKQLDLEQGNYAETAFNARVGTQRFGVSLDVTNLLNSAKNRFSLGNPFGVIDGRQITPQQPRTIRFGFDAKF